MTAGVPPPAVTAVASHQPVPLFIGGAELLHGATFEVRDPGRVSDVVAEVVVGLPTDVDRAVLAAEAGGRVWARVPLAERADILDRIAEELAPLAAELAPTLARENGGVLREAGLDLERSLGVLRSAVETARTYLLPRVLDTAQHWLQIEKKPIGVVGMIVPWNSPMVLAMSKIGPALAAGNAVVVKPSPEAPIALSRVLRALAEALPPGVVNIVNGGADVGVAISGHPRIRMVSFTGSVAVGQAVMRSAADTVKRVALELGGNDPAIVLDDADLAATVGPLAAGVFTRAGQICFGVKRVYVPRARYDEFYEALCEEVGGYRVGHGLDPQTTFGPLITERQRQRVHDLVERARSVGHVQQLGEYVDAGEAAGGWYLLPAVVRDIAHDSELVRVEQFGPVVPLVPYDDIEAAVGMANDSELGLASSVWGADTERAIEVAGRLEAGVTFVNSHNIWSLSFDMPFGGVKQSGLGRERTELGVQEYVEDHAIRLIKPAPPTTGS